MLAALPVPGLPSVGRVVVDDVGRRSVRDAGVLRRSAYGDLLAEALGLPHGQRHEEYADGDEHPHLLPRDEDDEHHEQCHAHPAGQKHLLVQGLSLFRVAVDIPPHWGDLGRFGTIPE